LELANVTLSDFLGLGKERLMEFMSEVPTLDVEIEIATTRDDHWNRKVDPNDMVDISVLSVAVPYCDILVTEKFWAHVVKTKHLDEKYDTFVTYELSDAADEFLKRFGV